MSRLLLLLAAAGALLGPARAGENVHTPQIHAEELLEHIKRLASDEWEGRGTGKPGEEKATGYIARHFESLGLAPAGEDGGFFQTVRVSGGFKVGPSNLLRVAEGAAFELDRDFRPFSASASAKVEGELVFAGYGIAAPEIGYDDYAGLDVAGRVVVVLRRAPRAPGAKGQALFQKAPFIAKLDEAVKRGAIGLIVVNGPSDVGPAPGAGGGAGRGRGGPAGQGGQGGQGRQGRAGTRRDVLVRQDIGGVSQIPFVHMTLAAGGRLISAAFGKTPAELDAAIHAADGAPAPASLPSRSRVRLETEVEQIPLFGRNVCALLKAGAPDAVDEIVVVGAHHDHVGIGGRGSLARTPEERRQIHNGADDNASGSAGVLELADYLAARRGELRRDILFLTFTGEELGLLGSRWFVDHPTLPLGKMVAMINMDMIGRLDGRKLFIGGVKTSPAWQPILDRLTKEQEVDAVFGEGGRAPSDNTSFYLKKLPVLFFFSGMHREYHRPADDWQRIDTAGIEKVARLAAATAEAVANLPERPVFQKADSGGTGPPRAILGINVAPADGGVGIGGVRPGSAAARAGLQAGDVIVALAGVPTADPVGLREVMSKRQPGEKIVVKVRRGEETLEVEVTLGGG